MPNPSLLEQFCSDGQKDAVSTILQTAGWSPENPNINGYQLNTIFNEIYTYLNYLKNKGLSFWEDTKTYKATAGDIDIVRYANKIYFAKLDSNLDGLTPKTPDTNPTYWGVLYDLDVEISRFIRNDVSGSQAIGSNLLIGSLSTSDSEGGEIKFRRANVTSLTTDPYIDINGNNFRIVMSPDGVVKTLVFPNTGGTVATKLDNLNLDTDTFITFSNGDKLRFDDVSNIFYIDVDGGTANGKFDNADKLDGLSSSQFLRSDTADAMYGSLTLDNGGATEGGQLDFRSSTDSGNSNCYIDVVGTIESHFRAIQRDASNNVKVIDFPVVSGNMLVDTGKSLTQNGYQKLSNGLIIQWGTASSSSGGTAVTFPVAFPTACLQVVLSDSSTSVDARSSSSNFSTTGYTGYNSAGHANNWFAIGY